MKILVTGAAGLYGVHLVDQLVHLDQIETVVGVDNFSRKFLQDDPFRTLQRTFHPSQQELPGYIYR